MNMGREENERGIEPVTRKLSVQGIGSSIRANGMTMTITDAYVMLEGERVIEVPVGEQFHIYASYECSWAEGSFLDPWAVAITVKGDGIANVDRTTIRADHGSGTMKLDEDGPNIMPDKDIVLTFKPWGHSEGLTQTLPDER